MNALDAAGVADSARRRAGRPAAAVMADLAIAPPAAAGLPALPCKTALDVEACTPALPAEHAPSVRTTDARTPPHLSKSSGGLNMAKIARNLICQPSKSFPVKDLRCESVQNKGKSPKSMYLHSYTLCEVIQENPVSFLQRNFRSTYTTNVVFGTDNPNNDLVIKDFTMM